MSSLLAAKPALVTASTAAAAAFPLLTGLTLAAWVYLDALARDSDRPLFWAVAVLFAPLLLLYVYRRGERTRRQSDGERFALTLLLALLSAMMVGTTFSPPGVFAQPRNTFGGLLVTLPLFYLIVYRDGDDEPTDADDRSS